MSKTVDAFHFLTHINRDVVKSHVRTIRNSIEDMDCIRPLVCANVDFIDGIKRRYIVDGQHLFHALVDLDREIPYVMITCKTEEELIRKIAKLNASSKSWTLVDYVRSWSWLEGKEDYKKLLKAFNTIGLSINALVMCFSLTDVRQSTRTVAGHPVKNGTFEIVYYQKGLQCAKYLKEIIAETPRAGRVQQRLLTKVFAHWFHEYPGAYDHNKFLAYVRRNRDVIMHFDDTNDEAEDFMNRFGGKGKIIELNSAVG
jgi:hypothetical protein